MAIAHICACCGKDQARVRPRVDEETALPLVECPACGVVVCRRPHPLQRTRVAALRLEYALRLLMFQLLMFGFFGTMTLLATFAFPEMMQRRSLADFRQDDWIAAFMLLILIPIGLGVWLRACFPHWKRGAPNVAFALFAGAILLISAASHLASDYLRAVDSIERAIQLNQPAVWDAGWFAGTVAYFGRAFMLLLVISLISHVGMAPGEGVRWLMKRTRAFLLRARLRRTRARRSTFRETANANGATA